MSENTTPTTKGRLLFLEHYLQTNTDDQHSVSTDELIEIYTANGFKANRNTIRDDIAILLSSGIDVIQSYKGKQRAYHIGNRIFDLAEVKTLVDAVSSSRFITAEKSEELIEKLTLLTSVHYRSMLARSAFAADRLKTESAGIFVTIDAINDAISRSKKISFQYIDYQPDKSKVLRHDGKRYVASPQAFLWNDDRYYVPSYSEEKGCIVPFRVDRMRNVEITDEDSFIDSSFNASKYSRKVLKMYDGAVPEQEVILIADNKHMLSIIDRFGEDIETSVIDDEHFMATVAVCPSSTFFAWVFQFSGGIRIAGPADMTAEYRDLLSQVMAEQYSVASSSASLSNPNAAE